MPTTYLLTNVTPEMCDSLTKYEVCIFSDDKTRAVIVGDKEPKGGNVAAKFDGNIAAYVQKDHLNSSILDDLSRQAVARNAKPAERKAAIKGWQDATAELEKMELAVEALRAKRSASCKEIALTHGRNAFEVDGVKCHVGVRRGGTLVVMATRGKEDKEASPVDAKASQVDAKASPESPAKPTEKAAKNGKAALSA